jgi:hypothetical protein
MTFAEKLNVIANERLKYNMEAVHSYVKRWVKSVKKTCKQEAEEGNKVTNIYLHYEESLWESSDHLDPVAEKVAVGLTVTTLKELGLTVTEEENQSRCAAVLKVGW